MFDSSLQVLQVAAHKGCENNTPEYTALRLEAHTPMPFFSQENSEVFQKVEVFLWNPQSEQTH